MAKYVIEDTTLTNTANAIREKTGGTKPITPSNFATEIASIQSGGGDTTQEDGLITKTLTEYSNNRVTSVGKYAFCEFDSLTSVILPSVTEIKQNGFEGSESLINIDVPLVHTIGPAAFRKCTKLATINTTNLTYIDHEAFADCSALSTVDFSNVTHLGQRVFTGCKLLTSLSFPKVTDIESQCFQSNSYLEEISLPELTKIPYNAFYGCKALRTISIPKVTSFGSSGISGYATFENCTSLKSIDLPSLTSSIVQTAFRSCSVLETVILRSETMCTLANTNAFTSTPIERGTGYIYVPDALVDSYKSATNWSTYGDQIKPISELEGN